MTIAGLIASCLRRAGPAQIFRLFRHYHYGQRRTPPISSSFILPVVYLILFIHSLDLMTATLLSVSILFRHGARGPGDSELSAFPESDPIVTQWQESELENLSRRGIQQISELGKWFALNYTGPGKIVKPKPFFRGSIADRAVDSARDFVSAFNSTLGFEVCLSLLLIFLQIASLKIYAIPMYCTVFDYISVTFCRKC